MQADETPYYGSDADKQKKLGSRRITPAVSRRVTTTAATLLSSDGHAAHYKYSYVVVEHKRQAV